MADRVGQQLGNYRLTRLLGQGGFGEVYLGEHLYLKTQAAIKVQNTQLAREDVEDFQAEARTVAHLEHSNIVRVLEFGIEGGIPFLVMSYAPNGSLRQRHPRGTPVPLPLILQYVRQVADALQYAHDEKLIHRDIKPENMLLGRRNEVLLSDFGIALISQTSRSKSVQEVIGTVGYMSPEMLQGKAKFASDQYSLGIVVYEWLCGERPFRGGFTEVASQHLFVPPPSLREKNAAISADLEQVVMTALAKDPQQRFSSVRAFAHALEQAGQSVGSQPTVSIPPPAKPLQPTQPATPPHSSRQPTIPPVENQFPLPLTGTLTPDQAVPSPMLNTPASAISQPVTGEDTSNPSVPPTWLATPAGQPLQSKVPASPGSDMLSQPNTAVSLSDETKSPRQGISRRAVILGLAGFMGMAAIGGSIALLSHRSTGPIQPSTGAIQSSTWHAQPSGTSESLQGVVWSGSRFVAVGDSAILTSSDGSTWAVHNPGTLLNAIAWSGSQFVAVGDAATILTSSDSSTWAWAAQNSFPTYPDLYAIAWSGKQFVTVGFYGTTGTSSDGSTWAWNSQNSGTLPSLNAIAWSGSRFVAVGGSAIFTSSDGINWAAQNSGTSLNLNAIAWLGSQFVAVGDSGTILTSPDGITWTKQRVDVQQQLNAIAWSGKQFVAVGTNGTILTSSDGSTWSAQTSGTSQNLNTIAWSGKQFVAVGDSGIILTSS